MKQEYLISIGHLVYQFIQHHNKQDVYKGSHNNVYLYIYL